MTSKTTPWQKEIESPRYHVTQLPPYGYFTVAINNDSLATFRVVTDRYGGEDIGLLSGADNERDYRICTQITGRGEGTWLGDQPNKVRDAFFTLVRTRGVGEVVRGRPYSIKCIQCLVCHHLLTDPESIKIGAGPSCRSRLFGQLAGQRGAPKTDRSPTIGQTF